MRWVLCIMTTRVRTQHLLKWIVKCDDCRPRAGMERRDPKFGVCGWAMSIGSDIASQMMFSSGSGVDLLNAVKYKNVHHRLLLLHETLSPKLTDNNADLLPIVISAYIISLLCTSHCHFSHDGTDVATLCSLGLYYYTACNVPLSQTN
jgi:hypothetical protein